MDDSFYFLTADIWNSDTPCYTSSPSMQLMYVSVRVTYRGVHPVTHKMRSEEDTVHGNISRYYPSLEKGRKNHKRKTFLGYPNARLESWISWKQDLNDNNFFRLQLLWKSQAQIFPEIFHNFPHSSRQMSWQYVRTGTADSLLAQVYGLTIYTLLYVS